MDWNCVNCGELVRHASDSPHVCPPGAIGRSVEDRLEDKVKALELQNGELLKELQSMKADIAQAINTKNEIRKEAYERGLDVIRLDAELKIANRLNGVMRLLLENADMAWAENWDCSAHPGHKAMHHVMPMISEFLNKTEKRLGSGPNETRPESPMLLGVPDGRAPGRMHLPSIYEPCPICGKEACGHFEEPKP